MRAERTACGCSSGRSSCIARISIYHAIQQTDEAQKAFRQRHHRPFLPNPAAFQQHQQLQLRIGLQSPNTHPVIACSFSIGELQSSAGGARLFGDLRPALGENRLQQSCLAPEMLHQLRLAGARLSCNRRRAGVLVPAGREQLLGCLQNALVGGEFLWWSIP